MKRKVLAVDDDRAMLSFMESVLESQDFEITCAAGGKEAIDLLKTQTFDVIVLDFYMPGTDGFDVVSSMYGRQDRTPVIIFSSRLEAHYEAAVQGFGIVRKILRKPCGTEELSEAVKEVLSD